MMNDERWIIVTVYGTGRKMAVNLTNVISVTENRYDEVYNGERSTIQFLDGSERSVYESIDEIGAMIR